jgi:hypothetical protein
MQTINQIKTNMNKTYPELLTINPVKLYTLYIIFCFIPILKMKNNNLKKKYIYLNN